MARLYLRANIASHSQARRTVIVNKIPPYNVVLMPIWYEPAERDEQEPKLMIKLSCILGKETESDIGAHVHRLVRPPAGSRDESWLWLTPYDKQSLSWG